ncbi:hypothetical protein D046_5916, partial [Vibrio parahaemolyticus V-223/04]
GNK